MLELYALDIKPLFHRPFDALLAKHLSAKAQAKARRCLNRAETVSSQWADMFVRVCIEEKLNVPNQAINFATTLYGKPVLREFAHLHFNLAHAGSWIVVAMDNQPVGIDVEEILPVNLDDYRGILTHAEIQALKAEPAESQAQGLFEIWTCKESYLKAIGTGFLRQANELMIKRKGEQVRVKDSNHISAFVQHYTLSQSCVAAACAFHNNFPDRIVIEEPSSVTARFGKIICA